MRSGEMRRRGADDGIDRSARAGHALGREIRFEKELSVLVALLVELQGGRGVSAELRERSTSVEPRLPRLVHRHSGVL